MPSYQPNPLLSSVGRTLSAWGTAPSARRRDLSRQPSNLFRTPGKPSPTPGTALSHWECPFPIPVHPIPNAGKPSPTHRKPRSHVVQPTPQGGQATPPCGMPSPARLFAPLNRRSPFHPPKTRPSSLLPPRSSPPTLLRALSVSLFLFRIDPVGLPCYPIPFRHPCRFTLPSSMNLHPFSALWLGFHKSPTILSSTKTLTTNRRFCR